MKNQIFTDISHFAGIAFRNVKKHVLELLNPETPSFKTSITAIPFFLLLAMTAGDRYWLFWVAMLGVVFFTVLAVFQYGVFSRKSN